MKKQHLKQKLQQTWWSVSLVFGVLVLTLCSEVSLGQQMPGPGRPDRQFGRNGVVRKLGIDSPTHSEIYFLRDVVFQSDGKIIAIGVSGAWNLSNPSFVQDNLVLIRYNSDGSLDTSFGDSGMAATELLDVNVVSAVLQPDGKIVVACRFNGDFLLARYTSNGVLDSSFGSNGIVITDTGNSTNTSHEQTDKVVLSPDGKITLAGTRYTQLPLPPPVLNPSVLITRYLPNGELDNSFGENGKSITPMSLPGGYSTSPSMDPAGNLFIDTVGGCCWDPHNPGSERTEKLTLKFDQSGHLDPTFGVNGILKFRQPNDGYVINKFLPKGRILYANYSTLRVYRSNGTFERQMFSLIGFGPIAGHIVLLSGLMVQPDNKILAVGSVNYGTDTERLAFARFFPDGTLDTSFGTDGLTIDRFFPNHGAFYLQPDGKYLYAAENPDGYPWGFVMERFLGDL